MKKILTALFCACSLLMLVSCKSEITLTAQKDGNVIVEFSGECGPYFEQMVRSFTGSDSPILFNPSDLKQDFAASGFKNISVSTPTTVGVSVKMTEAGNSFLTKSGLMMSDKKNVFVNLSPAILKNFYNSADESLVTVLDLLISPLFNDEEMGEDEYLEMIGSFYGNDASKEIKECNVKLTLISVDGQKKEALLPLAKLLCLNERISY